MSPNTARVDGGFCSNRLWMQVSKSRGRQLPVVARDSTSWQAWNTPARAIAWSRLGGENHMSASPPVEAVVNDPAAEAHLALVEHHRLAGGDGPLGLVEFHPPAIVLDRKSTRLNSSHVKISYAVFCLKKKK